MLKAACRLVFLSLAIGSVAHALPIQLKDQNGTRYNVNTDVDPLITNSFASGALTDATYEKPVTVTSYYIGFTPWFGFVTTYTVQRQVNVPLTNAFAGFNGLQITGVNGVALPSPLVFNPAEGVTEECPQNNKNRQLVFQGQAFPSVNLQLTRKAFVPDNGSFMRWLNVVTNTGSSPTQVAVTLRGLLGSANQTKIVATSTGDSSLGTADQWFTTAQSVPQGTTSLQPRIGFVIQGGSAPAPAANVGINSVGQTAVTYTPTIAPGGSAIILTFVTVQGSGKEAKSTCENVVALPAKALTCLTQQELQQIVNFPPIVPPVTKKATITLNFKKTGADEVQWKGSITIGAGISLQGLPVTVDLGGVVQTFVLNNKGKANDGGGNKFTLDANLKNGVTKAGTVDFSFQLKGDFQSTLAAYGLVNATVSNVPVSVPVSSSSGLQSFQGSQPFTYKATQGKSGTAKSSS